MMDVLRIDNQVVKPRLENPKNRPKVCCSNANAFFSTKSVLACGKGFLDALRTAATSRIGSMTFRPNYGEKNCECLLVLFYVA